MSQNGQDLAHELARQADSVEREVCDFVASRGRLGVIQAPPGSGKTTLLLKAADRAVSLGQRVAIATQTNPQANDICSRLAKQYPGVRVTRFASASHHPLDLGRSVQWVTKTNELPRAPGIVVAPAAKWGMVKLDAPFDVLFVEEAWQLTWANFMLLGQVAERFILVGDPGQIPPVVSVDVSRWETSPRAPHLPAPVLLLQDQGIRAEQWSLPATRRLPHDSVPLVRPFYDFPFGAMAAPGEQVLKCDGAGSHLHDKVIDLLRGGSTAACTIPTPDEGPPLGADCELANVAVDIITRLLDRGATIKLHGTERPLRANDIGLSATHRVMNSELTLALPKRLQRDVTVDTPERWQGLERPVMLVVHPLSSVVDPSAFDLETGRLCVMASRHQTSMVVLGRDHIASTLDRCIPSATQALGRADTSGRGLANHQEFWSALSDKGCVISA